jgi:predicted dehydrogenase
MKTLKIGIIGAGFSGQQHIEAIRRIPGTEVIALVENDTPVGEDVCTRMGIPRYYHNHLELLADPEVEIVHNCTPNSEHYPLNRDVILSGRHIFSEKPLAISTDESAALTALSSEYKVANAVNFNYRQNAMVQVMRQRLQTGEPGRLLTVHGHYLQDWLLFESDCTWRLNPRIGGPSRAVGDIGSHWFDLVQFVTSQKIREIYAQLITVHPVRRYYLNRQETFSQAGGDYQDITVETEDAAFIMFRLEDGTPGGLMVSQVCAGRKNDLQINISASQYAMDWAQENPDKLNIGHRDRPNELLFASPAALTGAARRYAPLPSGHPVAWADSLRNGIAEFYTSIRNGSFQEKAQTYATFQDGHDVMKVVEACLISDQEKRWVTID